MTINKSQGQSVEYIGINLQILLFSHGQLYVAFSKYTLPLNISVALPEQSQESRSTLNVVYKEVFNSIMLCNSSQGDLEAGSLRVTKYSNE